MSRIQTTDLALVRGDDLVKTLQFRSKLDGTPVDVSTWTFAGQVRTDPDAVDPPTAEFDFDDTDAADGLIIASLASADTALMNNRFYYYDIEATVGDLKRTRVSGRINMTKDTTREP